MKMNAKLLAALLPLSAIAAATEPQASDRVVGIFTELSKVPRYSGHEMNIGDWLIKWAADQGFNPTRDAAGRGNVIFDVPTGIWLIEFKLDRPVMTATMWSEGFGLYL